MPGFGHGRFGHSPFGHWNWSRQVLYDYMPELDKNQDELEGYPLLALVNATRPSFDKLKDKIEKFGSLRDPLLVRSQYNESSALVLGAKVELQGDTLQRGYNGHITAFGEFVASNARFGPTHLGKELHLKGSVNPVNNQVVRIAAIESPTIAVIAPPLTLDNGPLTWELKEPVVQLKDQTTVEVQFGDPSSIVPGWVLSDGFSEFELLSRVQLSGTTETEADDATINTALQLERTVGGFTLADIGKRVVLSGASVTSNNDKFEIVNVVRSQVSGTSGVITGVVAGVVTLSGMSGITASAIGASIAVTGSENADNDGIFTVATVLGFNTVTYINPAAVFPDSGSIQWNINYGDYKQAELRRVGPSDYMVAGTDLQYDPSEFHLALMGKPVITLRGSIPEVKGAVEQRGYDASIVRVIPPTDSTYPSDYGAVEIVSDSAAYAQDLSGTSAQIVTLGDGTASVSQLQGMEPSCINKTIDLTGSLPQNTGTFLIVKYFSSTTVHVAGPDLQNENNIVWGYSSPDKNKALTLRGPGPNNGTTSILYVTPSSFIVAQRQGALGNYTLDAGPLAFEIRTPTALPAISDYEALSAVELQAPSLLSYLATDYGLEIDRQESEARQRSWVRNEAQWIGIKGTAKSYKIIGWISGFEVEAYQLFRTSQDIYDITPTAQQCEVGEAETGRLGTDGSLISGAGGVVQFKSTAQAQFKPSDAGKSIRIRRPTDSANQVLNAKLYTIDQVVDAQTVNFRIADTAVVPDYGTGTPGNGNLIWNVTSLYSTLAPSRPRYDDMDPPLMEELLNPYARYVMPGVELPGVGEQYGEGDLLYCALASGTPGNSISVAHAAGGPGVSVSVVDKAITVLIDAGVTTAADVIAAITGSPEASALVTVRSIGATSTGHPKVWATPHLIYGQDLFGVDRFCWESNFESSLVPTEVASTASLTNLSGTLVTLTGTTDLVAHDVENKYVTISGAASPGNNGTFPIFNFLNPKEFQYDNAAAVVPDANNGSITAVVEDIVALDVSLTAENTWTLLLTGPLQVILSVQGGNWRIVDANGLELYVETIPVFKGSHWELTVYSAQPPVANQTYPSPIALHYDCSVLPSCDYCAASRVLLIIEDGDILLEQSIATRFERLLDRMLRRLVEVTPAHVLAVPRFRHQLEATWSWGATLEDASSSLLPLYAPLQAYYDDVPGDIIPTDTIRFYAEMEGAYFNINAGSIDSVVGSTVTLSGFSGPLYDVTGQTLTVTNAANPANNGTFIITGYTSGANSSVQYSNAAAVAPDANNGTIFAATSE